MSDLIERLRDYDPIEQQLRGLPIQQEAADEIECLKADVQLSAGWAVKQEINIVDLEAEIKRLNMLGKIQADRLNEALVEIERLKAVVDAVTGGIPSEITAALAEIKESTMATQYERTGPNCSDCGRPSENRLNCDDFHCPDCDIDWWQET